MHSKEPVAEAVGGEIVPPGAGSGAAVPAILGLSGVSPAFLAAIATIAVGAALLSEGGAIATRYSELVSESSDASMDDTELGAGMTTEFPGGIAGIVPGSRRARPASGACPAPAPSAISGP